jgi:heptosyltransferase-2
MHQSIHLLEEKPELFKNTTREKRKAIEKNPTPLYLELTPDMIIKKLDAFLSHHIKS